jgi:hypothetical protein
MPNKVELRPKYPPPFDMAISVSSSIFFGWPRRSIAYDATDVLNRHIPRPVMRGIEHIPKNGAFMIVANHHDRPDMWIGWVGAMITEAVNQVRPARTPIRIVVTDSQRMTLFGRVLTVPFSRWFLRRVARFWQMLPIGADPNDTTSHAATLKAALNMLRQGLPVLFFPEGDRGNAYALAEALPGTGTFIALASRRAVILPCAIWEDGEQLQGQILPPLTIDSTDDAAVRLQMMTTIGKVLPEAMWGAYANRLSSEEVSGKQIESINLTGLN